MNKIKIFSLGGLNENGKNMYILEINEDIFILDAGLKYADDRMLGVDYIIPDYEYLKINSNRIKGLFITHGHDKHMGAIADLLPDFPDLKIYGSKFTIEILKAELIEEKLPIDNLIVIEAHKKLEFGEISVFPVSLTHSVPDTIGYAINTKDGIIFYTGNFVFDPTMTDCYKTDIGKLAYLGKQGVLCLLSESLYAEKKGFTSPNHRMQGSFREIVEKNEKRIIINVLQAQLYRIQELFNVISETNKKIIIMGKRLENVIVKAIDMGYLNFDKKRLDNISHINDKNAIILVSDEREKPFSNINRIVNGYDKLLKINEEDTVVIAAPIYDGMEQRSTKMLDKIAKIGANLIVLSRKKYLEHHASSEDLMLMIDLMQPKYYFPVIGEYRDQVANMDAALKTGLNEDNIILKTNGEIATFINGKLTNEESKIKVDDILVDGKTVGDVGEIVLKDREALADNGIVIVTATLDKKSKKLLAGPEILTRGFIYVKDNAEIIKKAEEISLEVIKANTKPFYIDFNKVKMDIRDKLAKYLYRETECKPMILIVIQEV